MRRLGLFCLLGVLGCHHGLDTYFLEYDMDPSFSPQARKALVLPPKGYLQYSELPAWIYWSSALECARKLEGSPYLSPLPVDTARLEADMRELVPTYETYVDAGSLAKLAERYGAQAVVVPEIIKIVKGHRGNDPAAPTYYETTLILRVYGYPEAKLLYKAKARGEGWDDVGASVSRAMDRALGPLLR